MKKEIIIFVVGLLLGAIISTASIYVYSKTSSSNDNQAMQMNSGNGGMQQPSGQDGTTPPEMPNGDSTQTTN